MIEIGDVRSLRGRLYTSSIDDAPERVQVTVEREHGD
jgi:hypothetical protein